MEIRQIDSDFSVSAQLQAEHLEKLAEDGVKSIICNRPEHESPEQPELSGLQRAADRYGLKLHHQPVIHDHISLQDVKDFEALYQASDKPLHAFCRSGLRAMTLWGLMRIRQGEPPETITAQAQHAGFDFSNFQEKFAGVITELQGDANL